MDKSILVQDMRSKPILVSEPVSLVVVQTEHEKMVEKVKKYQQQQAASQLSKRKAKEEYQQQQAAVEATNRLIELKRRFLYSLITMSEIIIGLPRIVGERDFFTRFSSGELVALEEAIRQHPKYKMCIAFFCGVLPVFCVAALWKVLSIHVMLVVLPVVFLITVFLAILSDSTGVNVKVWCKGVNLNHFAPVRHFFLRRKLIRLGGPNAPEDAIKEMGQERWGTPSSGVM